jgi:hypothetical protein
MSTTPPSRDDIPHDEADVWEEVPKVGAPPSYATEVVLVEDDQHVGEQHGNDRS